MIQRSAPALFGVLFSASLLTLTACGPNDTDPGPGGVTVADARALDEAAEVIEQRQLPDKALPEGEAASSEPREE